MKLAKMSLSASLLALAPFVVSAEEMKLEDETARISYSLGYQIGGDFKRQGTDMNAEAVVKGIEDAISGAEPLMSTDEMRKTLVELKRKILEQQQAKKKEEAEKRRAEGKAFLEANAKQEGVVSLPSGLQYKIIEEGSGASPAATDKVTVNYRGTLIDGKEFDSSYKRNKPATFKLNGVIKGWTEGLQLIKEGGKMELYIPPELAYGERGALANQALIFEVELLSVGEKEPPKAEAAEEASETEGGEKE